MKANISREIELSERNGELRYGFGLLLDLSKAELDEVLNTVDPVGGTVTVRLERPPN